jgi:4-oxalocrotonate tautomerase
LKVRALFALERFMPFVEVKTIRGVFSTEEKSQIIEGITGVFARMKSDEFAAGTWVVVNELDDGNWGEGGAVLNADHVPESSSG